MGSLIKILFKQFKRVIQVDIVKVFSMTAVSTMVKMLTGLISIKIVASIIGPSGIALLGQLNNFSTIAMTLASGGINNGITKYVAEYKDSDENIRKILATGLRITIGCSFVIGTLMIAFQRMLSELIMLSSDYGYVFIIFGLTVCLYALNMMLTSILNGFKEFKRFVVVSIIGSIVGLLFTLGFVFVLGLQGALISAVTFQSVMFFVTFRMIYKLPWMSWDFFKGHIDYEILKKYFRYTLMTFVTAATVPVSQMVLRGYIISEISTMEAGWWEGLNRLSNMYLLLITSSFSVYYLPRLSEIHERSLLRHEIFKAYKFIIPLLLIGFTAIYFCRFFIINLLFTSEFIPMQKLFVWQLLGDFFKICSWVLAFLMIAKSMTRTFIMTEILSGGMFVVFGFFLLQRNGIIGVTQAYFVNFLLYTFLIFFCVRNKI